MQILAKKKNKCKSFLCLFKKQGKKYRTTKARLTQPHSPDSQRSNDACLLRPGARAYDPATGRSFDPRKFIRNYVILKGSGGKK